MKKLIFNKKFLASFLVISLLLCLTVMLTSCDFSQDSVAVGIESTYINSRGELVVKYTDGTIDNLGVVVGKDGQNGKDGEDGKDGINGKDGRDGEKGEKGETGENGKDGSVTILDGGSNLALATTKATRSSVSIVTDAGAGSGVIYKYNEADDGYFIITNYHVVYSSSTGISQKIQAYLYGSEYSDYAIDAEYVGGSMNYDIAVLYVENNDLMKKSCVIATDVFNSNDLQLGQEVIAVGNSSGSGISATRGIVSVISENLTMLAADDKTEVTFRVLRTDAPINKGNSGGGIFTSEGELVGIVNAKRIVSGVEGMGYAIPSTLACNVADNIIDNCYGKNGTNVRRALLGITIYNGESYSVINSETGAIEIKELITIKEVSSGSIVSKAMAEDIVISVTLNGNTVYATRQFHVIDFMLTARVGDTGYLTVERNGEKIDIPFKITEECITVYQ